MNAILFARPSVARKGAILCSENEKLGEIFDSDGQRKTRSGAFITRRSSLVGGLLPATDAVVPSCSACIMREVTRLSVLSVVDAL